MAGGVPADLAAFQHRDAGAKPGRLARQRQPCKARPDHADIDIEVER
jgi:hypothetical protein